MKDQNFIPNKDKCLDSDDSSSFEHLGGVEFDTDNSDDEMLTNGNSDQDFSSTVSEFDSNDDKSDFDLDEDCSSDSEVKSESMKEETNKNGDDCKIDESNDDCDSDDSEKIEATMEDIFGTKPNREANRNHPPNFRTNVSILDLCFHPENDLLAAASIEGDCIIYSYSLEKVEEVSRFSHHTKSCRQMGYNGDGNLLFSVSKDKSFAVLDIEASSIKTHVKDAHESPLYSFFEIDENVYATGDDNGIVKFWDLRKSKPVLEYQCGDQTITSFMACENNKYLTATVGDGSLTAFNIRKRRMEMQSEMYESELTCQSLVKEGDRLVVGSGSGALYIFKWGQFGYHIDTYRGHPDLVQCQVALTDKLILTGCEDGNIRALQLYEHKFLGVVGQHKDFGVENLAVSNDGNLLASCSLDEEIQFWNIEYLYSKYMGKKKHSKKSAISRNLSSSKRRNRGEFFRDIPKNVESDDDQNGPVAGPSYDSD